MTSDAFTADISHAQRSIFSPMRYDIAMIMLKSMHGPSTSRSMKGLVRTIAGLLERKGRRGHADAYATVIE